MKTALFIILGGIVLNSMLNMLILNSKYNLHLFDSIKIEFILIPLVIIGGIYLYFKVRRMNSGNCKNFTNY